MNEKEIRIAAGWIYKNKDYPDWWTPLVLTTANPAKKKEAIVPQDAFRVFDALKAKDFMKDDGVLALPNGQQLPKYSINWGKLAEFKEFADLSIIDRYFPEWLVKFLEAWRTLLVACAILIATAFLEHFFGKLGEESFDWLKAIWK